MLKILGAALLVLCGAAVGFGRVRDMRAQLALLRAMDASLALMAGEIELCARPLPEIFGILALRGARETRSFFARLEQKCTVVPAGEAWEQCCAELGLPEGGKRALLSLSAVLGAYDAQRQGGEIALVRSGLKAEEECLLEALRSKGRGCPALGACLAGIAALMII